MIRKFPYVSLHISPQILNGLHRNQSYPISRILAECEENHGIPLRNCEESESLPTRGMYLLACVVRRSTGLVQYQP